MKVVKDIWKRKSFSAPSTSSSSVINSRNATRPIEGSLSTGRIKGKRIKKDRVDVPVSIQCAAFKIPKQVSATWPS